MKHEADLTSAIARAGRVIAHLREQARQHNHPEWSVDILALLDLADEYQAAHTPEYQIDMVADHYDLILVKARDIPFPDDALDPDGRSGALYGAVGQLIGAADGIMRAAAALGAQPTAATHKLPEKIEIEMSAYRRELDTLLSHVREVREMVRERVEPEAVALDHGPLERAIIGNFVKEMQLTDKSIHVTVSIGDGIDLAVLERFVSRLASATREMIDSVKSWPGAAAKRVRAGIEAVRKPVSRAVGSVGGLILRLVRADGKAAVSAPEPPPIPEDYLEQAHVMILAGEAPPEHWAPLITELGFVGTRLVSLAPLAGLTALQELNLRATSVSDITPLAGLTELRNLSLDHTQVSDIAPLAGLNALQILSLTNTQVSDISPLADLNALQELDLWHTSISDIRPLAGLNGLQILSLDSTQASDISPLARLNALQSLALSRTRVSDISPLAGLKALRYLYLISTPVSDIACLSESDDLSIGLGYLDEIDVLRRTLKRGSKVNVRIVGGF